MSLVHKTLQKLNRQSKPSAVPPGMLNLEKRGRTGMPRKGLLILLVISVLGFAFTMYFESKSRSLTVVPPEAERTVKIKPAPVKPEPDPEPAVSVYKTPQISEADIQKRIDNAVRKALADADRDVINKMESTIEETVKRSVLTAALPKPAKPKIVSPEEIGITQSKESISEPLKKPENKKLLKPESTARKEPAEVKAGKKSAKPVLTQKQKENFNKKIAYNITLSLGNRAYQSGDYSRAVDKYAEALEVKPTPANLVKISKAKIAIGDIQGVFDSFSKHKEAVDGKVVSAVALEIDKVGFGKDALRLLGTYNNIVDKNSTLYYTAGQIHERHKKFHRAEAAYKKAAELSPSDFYYKYALARMLDTNGSYKDAVKLYKQIAENSADKSIKEYSGARVIVLEDYISKLPD